MEKKSVWRGCCLPQRERWTLQRGVVVVVVVFFSGGGGGGAFVHSEDYGKKVLEKRCKKKKVLKKEVLKKDLKKRH